MVPAVPEAEGGLSALPAWLPEPVLCARHQAKRFTYTVSFNPQKSCSSHTRSGCSILTSILQMRTVKLRESWYNFPKATQLINGRARIQIQASLTPRLRCFCVLVATVSPLWESQEAVALPGLTVEDDLEIYHVFLQVLLRLCPGRWSEFQKSGLPLQNNWQLLSFFGKNLLESQNAVRWSFLTHVCILTYS